MIAIVCDMLNYYYSTDYDEYQHNYKFVSKAKNNIHKSTIYILCANTVKVVQSGEKNASLNLIYDLTRKSHKMNINENIKIF